MAIKITCDICGKDISGANDAHAFADFQFCAECWKVFEPRRGEWHRAKAQLFLNFFDKEIEKTTKKTAKKPVPHTHVCRCKGGKPVAVATVKGTPKTHVHKLISTSELAKSIGAKAHTVQCFALRKGLGVIDPKKRVRMYNATDADTIRAHFENK